MSDLIFDKYIASQKKTFYALAESARDEKSSLNMIEGKRCPMIDGEQMIYEKAEDACESSLKFGNFLHGLIDIIKSDELNIMKMTGVRIAARTLFNMFFVLEECNGAKERYKWMYPIWRDEMVNGDRPLSVGMLRITSLFMNLLAELNV